MPVDQKGYSKGAAICSAPSKQFHRHLTAPVELVQLAARADYSGFFMFATRAGTASPSC